MWVVFGAMGLGNACTGMGGVREGEIDVVLLESRPGGKRERQRKWYLRRQV